MDAPNDFALVLLCHSVPEPSRILLAKRIKELRPSLPIMMLYNGDAPMGERIDASLHNLASPRTVLDVVRFLTAAFEQRPAMSTQIIRKNDTGKTR